MKNKFLFLVSLIVIGSLVQVRGQVHLGVKGGANISKLNGISYRDNYALGYQLGGFIGYDISRIVGLQAEVLFSQTNTKVENGASPIFDNAFKGRKSLNYVSVPVLVNFFPNSVVSFHAGPQFSILTNKNKTVLENGQQLFKSSDFSLVTGVELNLGAVSVYGRYSWGFNDISAIDEKVTSQQAQIGLALQFF